MAGDRRLEVGGVTVRFDRLLAVDSVDLVIEEAEIVALLGPSGCGKSTLLRAIAGLQPMDSGSIVYDGLDLAPIPPHQRGMGLMSQAHSLFPHRSVAENVAFGLELRRLSGEQRSTRVEAMLASVGLSGFDRRRIDGLSGGEAQRVALARTLAPGPALVMLDEPMGSLDRELRERLAIDIRRTLRAEGVSALVVTHDQDEAFTIADRVAVMRAGRVVQVGTPTELRRAPRSTFVAGFLGIDTFVEVVVSAEGSFVVGGLLLCRPDWPAGPAIAVVPPEAILVGGTGAAPAEVSQQRFRGDHFVTDVVLDGTRLVMNLVEPRQEGDVVDVSIDVDRLARVDG
jgi:thiamine transport system ATP-binding protein